MGEADEPANPDPSSQASPPHHPFLPPQSSHPVSSSSTTPRHPSTVPSARRGLVSTASTRCGKGPCSSASPPPTLLLCNRLKLVTWAGWPGSGTGCGYALGVEMGRGEKGERYRRMVASGERSVHGVLAVAVRKWGAVILCQAMICRDIKCTTTDAGRLSGPYWSQEVSGWFNRRRRRISRTDPA